MSTPSVELVVPAVSGDTTRGDVLLGLCIPVSYFYVQVAIGFGTFFCVGLIFEVPLSLGFTYGKNGFY